jgi:drug/metabolite transporter (DMT)-like permease
METTPLSKNGLFHLFIVYIVWSSTYLAIRVAVGEGSGFPPFAMGASRLAIVGIVLLAFAYIRKNKLIITAKELLIISISSVFLWTGGNGLLLWAEQHTYSGLAALLVSTTPMWAALLDSIFSKKTPSSLLIGSIFLGLGGIAVLIYPSLRAGNSADYISGLLLVGASLCWAAGSVYQKRNPIDVPDTVIAGYQTIIGGCSFLILSLLFNEPTPQPTQNAWLAWGYLIVFGSVFAFTSYVRALRLLPINIMMTYAFVNPVLAVFLGWLILGEKITNWTIAGAALVVLGVFGVFREQQKLGERIN